MATSSGDKEKTNKFLWIAGTAAVTAFTMFYVNKHLNEKDELMKLRYSKGKEITEGD